MEEGETIKTQNGVGWKIAHVIGVAVGAALFETFFVLTLSYFSDEWQRWLYLLVLIGGTVLNAALLTTDLVCYFLNKEIVYKFCITLYVMAVFFAVVFYALVATGFFEIVRDKQTLTAYLEERSAGVWLVLLFILLQFLQVVLLPIPSTVTVAAGALIFGPLMGSVYSLIGIALGSLVGFLVGRYAGYRVVAWLVGKSTLDKWLKKIKGKDKLFLTAMFLLPVFPDDVLCFVAGFSSMSVWYFLVVIMVSRVLAIFTTSYSITLIPLKGWGLAVWGVIIVAIIALFILLYKKSDAILGWIEKKFRRGTKVEEKRGKGEFPVEIVDPDGSLVKKGVKRDGEDPPSDGDGKA